MSQDNIFQHRTSLKFVWNPTCIPYTVYINMSADKFNKLI